MYGKVCIVTGANNGFGFETSKELARMGAQVVMICRSSERGEAARQQIATETGNRPDLLLADLVDQAQVKRAAAEFRAKYDRLDVLVNNAGYAYREREETAAGHEKTFSLNYLAYVTLTLELLDLILAAAPARIINTASEAHRWNPLDFDNLQGEKAYPPGPFGMPAMYGWTNLYRIMFTYTLAERLASTGVVANAHCPGFVPVKRSGMPWFLNALAPVLSLLPYARTPQQAAATILHLATAPETADQTGIYYEGGELTRSADESYDAAKQAQLWAATWALLGYEADPLTAILAQHAAPSM